MIDKQLINTVTAYNLVIVACLKFQSLYVGNNEACIGLYHSMGVEARFPDSKSCSTWCLPSGQQHSADSTWRPALSVLATSRFYITSRLVKLFMSVAMLSATYGLCMLWKMSWIFVFCDHCNLSHVPGGFTGDVEGIITAE